MSRAIADSPTLCADRANEPRDQKAQHGARQRASRQHARRATFQVEPGSACAMVEGRRRRKRLTHAKRSLGELRALVSIMQEFGQLLAQGFVALALVADDDRVLEEPF